MEQPDTEQHDVEVEPNVEPAREPFDPHLGPLDDDDDARFLDPIDPRRRDVEKRRGRIFGDDDEPEHERRRLFHRRHHDEDED